MAAGDLLARGDGDQEQHRYNDDGVFDSRIALHGGCFFLMVMFYEEKQ